MSDADRVALRYVEESAYGVTPSGELLAKTTVAAADADNSYNDAVEDLSVFKANQLIYVSGFTTAANNGLKTVVSATAAKIIVEESLTTEVLGDTVSIKTSLRELRYTGESLHQETDTQESSEIRDDRQIADVVRTGISGAGGFNFELSYGAFDDFLEAMLMSAGWSTIVASTEVTYSMSAGDNSINDSGSAFVSDGFLVNQWIEIRGFTTAANNGYFKIVSVAVGKMVLSGGTVETEVAGDSVTLTMGAQIVQGTSQRFFTFERENADLSNEFTLLAGMSLDKMTLQTNNKQLLTGDFGLLGKSEVSASSSTATGTADAAPTNEVMSAAEDVSAILENQAAQEVSELTMEVMNNLRQRGIVGSLSPADIGKGQIKVTGTIRTYFESKTLMDKYRNYTSSSLAIITEDSAGNVYIIDMPKVKYTAGQQVAGGKNTDIIADMSFAAYREPTEDVTIRIVRIAA